MHFGTAAAPSLAASTSLRTGDGLLSLPGRERPNLASLTDYRHFHGMLIGPAAAARCVRSFNGRVLFMPAHRAKDPKAFDGAPDRASCFDFSRGLTLFGYFALVVASFTGLSTLLQCTETMDAREVSPQDSERELPISEVESDELTLAKDYIRIYSRSRYPTRLIRRFQFNFRLSGIKVRMFHFLTQPEGTKGAPQLHLVEFYQLQIWHHMLRSVVAGGILGGAYVACGF
eukprot:scaffold108045_cov40-Tisochrysis_lutea.AAC.1